MASQEKLERLLKQIGISRLLFKAKSYSVLAGKEIQVTPKRSVLSKHNVVTQFLTIKNTSKKRSSPINSLKILDLTLNVTLREGPYAIGFGGMAGNGNTGSYPPAAYRMNEVIFGEKVKGDQKMAPTRWWGGHRYFELKSGVDGSHASGSLPIMFFGWEEKGKERGLWIGIEWSGRWSIEASTDEDGRFNLSATIPVKDMVLDAGEVLELPKVHLGHFEVGKENGFNAIRAYIMDEIIPPIDEKNPQALLAYDHWMGIHGELTEKNMWPQVKAASALGLEYFVIDAGWFSGMENGWMNAVGNWESVNRKKFPRGLRPLAEYAKANGLKFGLWLEPERAAVGSDWLKKYPKGYLSTGKDRYHLDFSQVKMQDAVIEMLSKHITELDLKWIRWDYNQNPGAFWDAADPTGKIQFYCIKGLYRVWDVLLKRFPGLMFELGWRMDFGSMRRSVCTIMADFAEDPHMVRVLQTTASRVIPATYLNGFTYQGPEDELITSPLKLISRMAGSFTLNGCISRYKGKDLFTLKKYLDGYKSFKHLLTKNFYALTECPVRGTDPDIVEYVSYDGAEAVILAFKPRGKELAHKVFPKGLQAGKGYLIKDPFNGKKYGTFTGKALMSKGLDFTLGEDSAEVKHLVAAK